MTAETLLHHAQLLCRHRISPPSMVALLMAWPEKSIGMKDLAETCSYSSAAASGTLDGLVNKGLCARGAFDDDRRQVHFWLTPTGHDTVRQILESHCGTWNTEISGGTSAAS